MRNYHIVSSDFIDLGIYRAENVEGALDAMAREAGYESQADALARGVDRFCGSISEEQESGEWISHPYPAC